MVNFDYDLVVLGGGAAGISAATTASSLGAKTLIIEKEPVLGGECLHYGCIPSKTLIKSAAVYYDARNASRFGLADTDLPLPDPLKLRERVRSVISTIQQRQTPRVMKDKFNVETLTGSAKFVDPHVLILDGKKITAKNVILATGSRAQIPQIEGLKDVPFLTNREIFSLEKFPKTLAILGGGANALEIAQTMNRLGVKVSLIDYHHRLLTTEDSDIAAVIQRRLTAEGVNLLINHRALKVVPSKGGISLTLEDSENGKTFSLFADALFLGTGRRANVEGLGLEDIGIEFDTERVRVDRELRTSQENILAAGDVNGDPQYAHAAISEGQIAALNAILHGTSKVDNLKVPFAIYLDPEVASVGYNEMRAHSEGIVFDVHVEHFRDNERALVEGEPEGFIKIILQKEKPIGVQIVGAQAADLIAEWVTVLNGDMTLSRVARSIHAYPTQASINQFASGRIVNPKFFDSPVVKWLSSL